MTPCDSHRPGCHSIVVSIAVCDSHRLGCRGFVVSIVVFYTCRLGRHAIVMSITVRDSHRLGRHSVVVSITVHDSHRLGRDSFIISITVCVMHVVLVVVLCSLKMECEKLAQEKTEMQRHYVMVSARQLNNRWGGVARAGITIKHFVMWWWESADFSKQFLPEVC